MARGRTTVENRTSAITRAAALVSRAEVVRAALDRVTCSQAFQSSKRAQEFLRYVVERAIAGEVGHLKERSIGAAVYGRNPAYDTGADAVVRVAANDVRKRLVRYYQEAGPHETVRLELPSGCYVPQITVQDEPEAQRTAATTPAAIISLRYARWRAIAIAGWSVAVLACLFWLWGAGTPKWSGAGKTVARIPWAAIFDGIRPPILVTADSSMGILRDLQIFPVSLEDYAYRRFLEPPAGLSPELSNSWRLIAEKRLTSIADARIASEFQKLAAGAGRTAVVHSARDLQLGDFRRGDNLVLLGSSASNPWVELFQDQLDFQIQMDTVHPRQTLHIRNPNPRDPPGLLQSISTGNTGDSYAALALVRGLDGKGRVLIAQGTSMEGTDVAGDLALNGDVLAGVLNRCGISASNHAARFEVLLRLSVTAGTARTHEIRAVRCKP